MTEGFDERFERHEEMIQALARVWMRQSEMNERMDAFIERQSTFNAELVGLHRDIDSRLGRIETILERMLPSSTNGREG